MFAVMCKKGTADPRIVEDVTARMLADSRAKRTKWVAPAQLRGLSYYLDPSDNELLANPQFQFLENGLPLSWFAYGNPRIDTSGVQSASVKLW